MTCDLWLILQISEPSNLASSSQEAAAGKRPKDDTELPVTDSQSNRGNPEECSTTQEPETPERTEELKTLWKDEEVPQQMQNGQDRVAEAEVLGEPELLNGRISADTSGWHQGDESGNVLSAEKDTGFNIASSVDSFHTNTTKAIMEQTAEVLCETGQVLPAETQGTINRKALMKTE